MEYGIIFLDSYKYFPQSLSTLSNRFNLPVNKGFFSFASNIAENWGRRRKTRGRGFVIVTSSMKRKCPG